MRFLPNFADEPETSAHNGAKTGLLLARIADRPARSGNPAGEGGLRHDAAAPNRLDQFVFADDTVTMLEQVNQDVEDLRLDVNRLAATTQLPTVWINFAVTKDEDHRAGHQE